MQESYPLDSPSCVAALSLLSGASQVTPRLRGAYLGARAGISTPTTRRRACAASAAAARGTCRVTARTRSASGPATCARSSATRARSAPTVRAPLLPERGVAQRVAAPRPDRVSHTALSVDLHNASATCVCTRAISADSPIFLRSEALNVKLLPRPLAIDCQPQAEVCTGGCAAMLCDSSQGAM